jgi:hypothetical protein
MRVTLCWDVPEGKIDQTVTVDDARGRQLLRDGHARLAASGPFDPAEHSVAEVNAYLDSAPDEERTRVLSAEVTGKNRAGIVNR